MLEFHVNNTRCHDDRVSSGVVLVDHFDSGLWPTFSCGIRLRDSLLVVGSTLVRRTIVTGRGTYEEVYKRR